MRRKLESHFETSSPVRALGMKCGLSHKTSFALALVDCGHPVLPNLKIHCSTSQVLKQQYCLVNWLAWHNSSCKPEALNSCCAVKEHLTVLAALPDSYVHADFH